MASEKGYCRVCSTRRSNGSFLDDIECKPLDLSDPLLFYQEVNCKGSVAAGLPWNVRIQPYKPREVGGLESSAQ